MGLALAPYTRPASRQHVHRFQGALPAWDHHKNRASNSAIASSLPISANSVTDITIPPHSRNAVTSWGYVVHQWASIRRPPGPQNPARMVDELSQVEPPTARSTS